MDLGPDLPLADFTSTFRWNNERIHAMALYCSDGRWGESFDEFLARWPRSPSAAPRLASFVDEMCARFPEATIIAVTHGGIVDDLLGGHEHWPHCGITELVN